jgi:hypothetical protein
MTTFPKTSLILEQRYQELNEIWRLLDSISNQTDFAIQWKRILMERRRKLDKAIGAVRELESNT